jgi:hypothetical protein
MRDCQKLSEKSDRNAITDQAIATTKNGAPCGTPLEKILQMLF